MDYAGITLRIYIRYVVKRIKNFSRIIGSNFAPKKSNG